MENSDIFGESGYNPGAVGAFFSEDVNVVSKPFLNDNGVFVFLKETPPTMLADKKYLKVFNVFCSNLLKYGEIRLDSGRILPYLG